LLLACLDLSQKPLSRLDELASLAGQGPKKAQFLGRQGASGVRPEYHESGNQFSVNPIRFRACAPTGDKGLDLGGRQLPRCDLSGVKRRPELPFLTASCFKTDLSAPVMRDPNQLLMSLCRVCNPQPVIIRQAMDV
jgi:hypothetical protein